MPSRLPTAEAVAAPIWTIGPSCPADPPDPMLSAEAMIFTTATRPLICPPRVATAVITSGTPWPPASGANRWTSGPTIRPPSAGRKMTADGPSAPKTAATGPKKNLLTAASE